MLLTDLFPTFQLQLKPRRKHRHKNTGVFGGATSGGTGVDKLRHQPQHWRSSTQPVSYDDVRAAERKVTEGGRFVLPRLLNKSSVAI